MGLKQPGHEADHSPPRSAKFKDVWSYTSTPSYISLGHAAYLRTGSVIRVWYLSTGTMTTNHMFTSGMLHWCPITVCGLSWLQILPLCL